MRFEVALLPLYKPAYEHITLVNQRDGYVGYRLGRALPYLLTIDSRVKMRLAKRTSLDASRIAGRPLFQTAHTQKILVVEQQLV